MASSLFIAGTGTDVGKTYISALIVKKLRDAGLNAGYYKVAVTGVDLDANGKMISGDPVFVNQFANIGESAENLVSYFYTETMSPHLAAKITNRPIDLDVIERDYQRMYDQYDYLVVEGSGGVLCPLKWRDFMPFFTLDVVIRFELPIMLVVDSGIGTINSTILSFDYLKKSSFKVDSIIMNRFTNNAICNDNAMIIEDMTGLPIVAKVEESVTELDMDVDRLKRLFY